MGSTSERNWLLYCYICFMSWCHVVHCWRCSRNRGGRFASLVRLLPLGIRFEAITLGHIVLGLNHTVLKTHRLHEHAHVRQYERWGMLFFPLYLGSSLAQLLRGRDPHFYNPFEQEAFMNAASATGMPDTRSS